MGARPQEEGKPGPRDQGPLCVGLSLGTLGTSSLDGRLDNLEEGRELPPRGAPEETAMLGG